MSEPRIAIYIRLSSADEETGKKKDESNSVVNQRSLIHAYLDKHPEFANAVRREFVDDGFSGTNTDRPAFQEMVKQIRDGMFNTCITKDFSRFSRDYIEMGDYLECLFPFLKIRYISINDNYDSADYKGTTGGLDVVLRNIVYDSYSKDLSVKVKTAMIQCAKKGQRINGEPCYGYISNPENPRFDIPDPETAPIVRRIFDLALEGMRPAAIAHLLNDEGVLTPGQYYLMKHPGSKNHVGKADNQRWGCYTIRRILDKLTYTGAAVGMMKCNVAPCSKVRKEMKRDEWIVVPGMHEAIVSEEEYQKVQKIIHSNPAGERNNTPFPLKSLVVCGYCGRKMARWNSKFTRNPRFYCTYGGKYGNITCKDVKSPFECELEKIVLTGIKDIIARTGSEKKFGKSTECENSEKRIAELNAKIKALDAEKMRRYESYTLGECSKEEFLKQKDEIIDKIRELETQIDEADQTRVYKGTESEMISTCQMFTGQEELTYEMAHAFVEQITIYRDYRVEITWKFKDCLS